MKIGKKSFGSQRITRKVWKRAKSQQTKGTWWFKKNIRIRIKENIRN